MERKSFYPAWWVYEALQDFDTRVFFVTGGLGSGKTDGASTWLHDRISRNPLSKFFWFFEPTHRKIEDSAIPRYTKHLSRLGFSEGRHYTITKSPHYKLTYHFGIEQEVHFHSYDRPDLIVGTEIGGAVLDEAGDSERKVFENIRARIRDTEAKIRQFMVCGAPQGLNWFSEEGNSDENSGWDTEKNRDHSHAGKLYRRFTLWTDDNIGNLPPDYIQILDDTFGHNANLIKSYRFGIFCPLLEGAAYANYYPQRHDIEDIAPDSSREIFLTYDFNAQPLAWSALQRVTFDEYARRTTRYVLIHEAADGIGQLDDSVVDFARKFPPATFSRTPIKIYGDASGHAGSHKSKGSDYDNIKRYLEELGYSRVTVHALRYNPLETDSVEALNKLFSLDLLHISRRCNLTRKSLMGTTWSPGKRKLHKPPGETVTHRSDSMKYFAYAELSKGGEREDRQLGINI